MRKFILLCVIFSFPFGALHASSTQNEVEAPAASELSTIHTYGGGRFFKNIFDAVHIFVFDGADSQTEFGKNYRGLLAIAFLVGTLSAYILALSKESFRPVVKRWLPTFLVIFSLVCLRSDVYIKDHLVAKSGSPNESVVYKVEGVPLILAKSAALLSWLSYRVTNWLETATHGLKDDLYNWTGHIFAGETLFKAGQAQVSDANLDRNLKNFCYSCIAEDLQSLNPPYTRKELFEADDLLDLLSRKTNPYLSFSYIDDNGTESLQRCHIGIEKIKNKIQGIGTKKEIPFLSSLTGGNSNTAIKGAIYGNIGNPAGLLMKNSNDAIVSQKKFLEQHYLIDAIGKYHNPPGFTSFRATQIQRANQKTMGSLAVQYIVYIRVVLEGLAYMSFPIIIIFALASIGCKAIMHWFQLLVWISLWPPFFVVVKFLLQIIWEMRLEKTFGTSNVSFNMFSSFGLSELYESMEGAAAAMLATIGTLTFFLMKGGGHMMANLASSLNSPAHAAASTASLESSSGNYSFGNINYGNRSFSKFSGVQWDTNAALSQGKTTVSEGSDSVSANADGSLIIGQGISNLGADLKLNQTMGNRLQQGVSLADSHVQDTSKTLGQAKTDAISSGENLLRTLDKNENWSNSLTGGEQQQAMQAYDEIQAYLKNFKDSTGTSKQISGEIGYNLGDSLLGKVAGLNLGGKGSIGKSWNKEHGQSAESSERFSENMQTLSQIISNSSMGENFSELQKSAKDFNQNMSNVASLAEQHRVALTEQQTANDALEHWKTKSADSSINLNNEYVDYLRENNSNDLGLVKDILKNPQKNAEHMEQFFDQYEEKLLADYQKNQSTLHQNHGENKLNIPQDTEISAPEAQSAKERIAGVDSALGEGGENVTETIAQNRKSLLGDAEQHKEAVGTSIENSTENAAGNLDPENSKAKDAQKNIEERSFEKPIEKKGLKDVYEARAMMYLQKLDELRADKGDKGDNTTLK